MPARKRATVYFEPALYDALRMKAAEERSSISEIVNAAVRQSLEEEEREDAADLAIFEQRRNEPTIPFEDFVADLKRRGKL
jgi:Arc/MetJ-type ribon-helix-helix transcriptional regulator